MLSEFVRGFSGALSGLRAIRTPGLGRFVVVPILVSAATLILIVTLAGWGFDALLERLQGWLPGWLSWLEWLLWPLFLLAILFLAIYGFTLLANLLGAPFNGMLAEKYEDLLGAARPGPTAGGWLRLALTALLHEMRKLLYMLRWLLFAALLFVIPGVNLFAPLVWVLLGAWLLGLEYFGYPMDNHAVAPAAQRARLRSRRMLVLGFGAGILVLASVPLLNLLAMPAGVLGATRLWYEEIRGE